MTAILDADVQTEATTNLVQEYVDDKEKIAEILQEAIAYTNKKQKAVMPKAGN